jgi:hypothetical protein
MKFSELNTPVHRFRSIDSGPIQDYHLSICGVSVLELRVGMQVFHVQDGNLGRVVGFSVMNGRGPRWPLVKMNESSVMVKPCTWSFGTGVNISHTQASVWCVCLY